MSDRGPQDVGPHPGRGLHQHACRGLGHLGDEAAHDAPAIPLQKVDPRLEEDQRARLKAFKESRDGGTAQAALQAVERAARDGDNLLPHILAAVEARATLGEIADRLRAVFGTYRPAVV